MEEQKGKEVSSENAGVGWGFFLWWVLATSVAWVLAGQLYASGQGRPAWIAALIGTVQYFVLQRHISKAWWWIIVTFIGGGLGPICSVYLPDVEELIRTQSMTGDILIFGAVSGAVNGVSIGVMQWLFLRRRVHQAGWWILASTVGMVVGVFIGSGVSYIMGFAIGPMVGGLVIGAITGLPLMWLLRQPLLEAKVSEWAIE